MAGDDFMYDERLEASETLTGYDRWARSYDQEANPLVAATAWVLDLAQLGCADADVLELGCGTGRNARRVIAEGARSYVGLDGSRGMLQVALSRYSDPRISFGVADLNAPWGLPQQFDYALIVLVLEHLPNLEPLLVSLSRAMRPRGRVRIVDLHPERIAAGAYAHFREGSSNVHFASVAHSLGDLSATADAVGFDVRRRDWVAADALIAAVPRVGKYRGHKLVLDMTLTRRERDRRGSADLR